MSDEPALLAVSFVTDDGSEVLIGVVQDYLAAMDVTMRHTILNKVGASKSAEAIRSVPFMVEMKKAWDSVSGMTEDELDKKIARAPEAVLRRAVENLKALIAQGVSRYKIERLK